MVKKGLELSLFSFEAHIYDHYLALFPGTGTMYRSFCFSHLQRAVWQGINLIHPVGLPRKAQQIKRIDTQMEDSNNQKFEMYRAGRFRVDVKMDTYLILFKADTKPFHEKKWWLFLLGMRQDMYGVHCLPDFLAHHPPAPSSAHNTALLAVLWTCHLTSQIFDIPVPLCGMNFLWIPWGSFPHLIQVSTAMRPSSEMPSLTIISIKQIPFTTLDSLTLFYISS